MAKFEACKGWSVKFNLNFFVWISYHSRQLILIVRQLLPIFNLQRLKTLDSFVFQVMQQSTCYKFKRDAHGRCICLITLVCTSPEFSRLNHGWRFIWWSVVLFESEHIWWFDLYPNRHGVIVIQYSIVIIHDSTDRLPILTWYSEPEASRWFSLIWIREASLKQIASHFWTTTKTPLAGGHRGVCPSAFRFLTRCRWYDALTFRVP